MTTIEDLAARFVHDEIREKTKDQRPMPWKVVRSAFVRYADYHEVDRAEPGILPAALRAALTAEGYTSNPVVGTNGKTMPYYSIAFHVGTWATLVMEIDELMRQEGRPRK